MIEAAAYRRHQIERAAVLTAHWTACFISIAKAGKLESISAYLPDENADGEPVSHEPPELEPEQEELVWNLVLGPDSGKPAVH